MTAPAMALVPPRVWPPRPRLPPRVAAGLGLATPGFLLFLGAVDEVHYELVGGVPDEGVDGEAK